MESLIEFENFTNLSVNADNVLLRGEWVINSLYRSTVLLIYYIATINELNNCVLSLSSAYLETSTKEELFLLLSCKVNRSSLHNLQLTCNHRL